MCVFMSHVLWIEVEFYNINYVPYIEPYQHVLVLNYALWTSILPN